MAPYLLFYSKQSTYTSNTLPDSKAPSSESQAVHFTISNDDLEEKENKQISKAKIRSNWLQVNVLTQAYR